MMNGKSGVDIFLDLREVKAQTFVEIPVTVRNNTSEVLVLDTFLIRDDSPGDVVILAEPPWKRWIYGTLDDPLAQIETEVYVAFLKPGEEITSKMVVKFLFEGKKRVTGRLTYERIGLEEFEKRIVSAPPPYRPWPGPENLEPLFPRETIEIQVPGLSLLHGMEAYRPGGGTREKAFIKRWVLVSPSGPGPTGCSVTGPEWILPSAEPRIIEQWVYCVALKTWAIKEQGDCIAVPQEGPVTRLSPKVDLSIFDYADACAFSGLEEIENGFLAGEMIGGNLPELDQLELGVAHRATFGGRLFSVKIGDLVDALVKIGASKDFPEVEYIGVQIWPGHVRMPLTPDTDWTQLNWGKHKAQRAIDPST